MENEDYREMLEAKRFEIVQHLQVDRTFVFDYLRHKSVLDSEDCELIQCEKTTSAKIGKFVDVLARKGPQAYQYLLESLQLEHPGLYEKLTGKKADPTTNPIMLKLKKSFTGVGGPLRNSELEILTRHLVGTYGDLHEMSRKFEQVVQHKKDIEEQLDATTIDLERHKEKVDFLEKKIDSERTGSMPSNNNNNWTKYVQYVDSMRKEVSNRDIYIIALQTNLMSSREEIESLKKKNNSMLAKNDELHKMIDEMSKSFHNKKCESLRLSERIERQGNEIKKAELTMRKYRECQFQNMRLREEKEHLQEELEELNKWTDALKTRFDIVEYEKKKTMSDHTEIMADFGSLQEELMKCREEMNEVQLVAADLRERVRHLEHDRQTYKRQRDGALTSRREAIHDRDKAFLERDQAMKRYNEIKSANDTVIEDKILQLKSYDEVVARSDVMEEEIKQVKIKLRQTERELEELKVKCGIAEEMNEKSEVVEEQENCETSVPDIKIVPTNCDISVNVSEESGSTSRLQVSSANTIKSIKRRVGPPSPTFHSYEPIFPESYNSFPTFSTCVSTNIFKEMQKKEGRIDRNRITRMPIKMRQNSSEEDVATEIEERGRVRNSPTNISVEDGTEVEGDNPPDGSDGKKATNGNNKVIHYL